MGRRHDHTSPLREAPDRDRHPARRRLRGDPRPEIARWQLEDALAVIVIATLTIVAERCSIPLRRGSETVNFALTDGVWAGALLLVSPSILTVAVLLGVGVGQALNRWKAYKITYNVSQFLIGITLAEIAFSILGGGTGRPIRCCGLRCSPRCTSRSP